MCILPEYHVFLHLQRSPGTLHWWQRKANPILKDIYPDLHCWVVNLSGAEVVHMLRMGKSVTTPNRRAKTDVSLWHLPQSRVLQESYHWP